MKVFVERLWSSESRSPRSPEVERFSYQIAQVDTGADDRVGYHVVFVHTCAYEYAHPPGFPLVLQVCADDIHVLAHVASVAEHDVLESVVVEFAAGGQFRWQEKEFFKSVRVLHTGDNGKIGRVAVCVGVHAGAVIRLALYVLHGHVCVDTVFGRRVAPHVR